ncbi:hypothetical protein HZC27_02955 [Candidatus Roizmanbacteria bacterium]|nr:hypothetical protein [Candidatus Roizmanbacteria bacterium]
MFNFFKKLLKGLLSWLAQWFRYLGFLLITLGYIIIDRKDSYQLVRNIIENLLRSIEIRLKVINVLEREPLYVTFVIEVSSSNYNRIDWSYFIMELVLQLGCTFTDVNTHYEGSSGNDYTYHVDITKTALSNLEKGITYRHPDLYEKHDNEYLLNRSLELSRQMEITPEVLVRELDITEYRAEKLCRQLVKSKSLFKPVSKNKRMVN